MNDRRRIKRWVGVLAWAALTAAISTAHAQETAPAGNPLLDREFEFASGLISKLKMPDLAERVMDQVELAHPEAKDRAKVVRAEALVARRRFRQAEDLVADMPKDNPKAQAIMLALADGYFQVGEREKTRGLYVEFFNRYTNAVPTDPDVKRFFRDAAYKFGQMLAMANDPLAAAMMYDKIIPLLEGDERDQVRQIKMEQAELFLRAARHMPANKDRAAHLKRARVNSDEVLWGGMDLWFGRAVTALAQADLIEGEEDKAVSLLDKNMEMLKKADELLADAGLITESPYAGAQSLLGKIHKDRADVLTGAREAREAEALRFFERAADEFDGVWRLILRVAQRDANLLAQAEKNKTTITLPGTPERRQEPYEKFLAAIGRFERLLTDRENEGWSPALAERKNKLKERVVKLAQAAADQDKKIGVSPQSDLIIEDNFMGFTDIGRGVQYLAAEEERLKNSMGRYAEALKRFYTVFATYPGSDWSNSSGAVIEEIKDRIKALTGQDVTIESRQGGREKIARVVIREGHNLFGRKEYEKAAEQYLKALNDYPEGEEALGALANLMECYAHVKDMLSVRMTARYLAERFAGNPLAAQGFLRVGRVFFEAANREMYLYVYERYLEGFPDHVSAPEILYMLGEQRWKAEDYEGSVVFYRRLADRYTKTPRYLQALSRVGWAYYLRGEYAKAIEGFLRFLAEAQAGPEKAQAKLCLADSYRQLGDFSNAFTHYQELTGWLASQGGPYNTSVQAMRQNEEVHRQAMFFMGHCKNMMAEPGEAGAAARREALALLRQFVEKFPKADLAPSALSSIGAILLGEGRADEASATYQELATQYPQSDAGQNARLAMLRSLIEIQRLDKADEVLNEMLRESDKYPADQFQRAGLLFADRNSHEPAVRALNKAIEKLGAAGEAPGLADQEQRALMALGRAQSALNRHADAAKTLGQLIEKYPRSALFFEARFLLGRALKDSGQAAAAMEVLRDVFTRATDQRLITRATIELAGIQTAQGEAGDALASYQRVVLLAPSDDPVVRPLFRQALRESIRLFRELGRWKNVVENANKFTAEFPAAEGAEEIRQWRSEAIMRMTTGAGR